MLNLDLQCFAGPNTSFATSNAPLLTKLFEDPEERESRIQSSIARSR
jgi:hypothetical protein